MHLFCVHLLTWDGTHRVVYSCQASWLTPTTPHWLTLCLFPADLTFETICICIILDTMISLLSLKRKRLSRPSRTHSDTCKVIVAVWCCEMVNLLSVNMSSPFRLHSFMLICDYVCLDSLAPACRWNSSGMEVQAVLLKYVWVTAHTCTHTNTHSHTRTHT